MSTPAEGQKDQSSGRTRHLRLLLKLFGAELQWHSAPTPAGITLRDYFAASALMGVMWQLGEDSSTVRISKLARTAYRVADALVEARGDGEHRPVPKSDRLAGDTDQQPGIE